MGDAELETWRNGGQGPVYILKYDKFGNETHVGVTGGKSFSLTKAERLLNMDRAADSNLDVFSNGTLTPVRLLEGDEDAKDLANNPNLMTETDMTDLFSSHWKTFQTKVGEISNTIVLHRLLDLAQSEAIDATLKQQTTIQARLKEVDPHAPTEVDVQQVGNVNDDPTALINPVTPR